MILLADNLPGWKVTYLAGKSACPQCQDGPSFERWVMIVSFFEIILKTDGSTSLEFLSTTVLSVQQLGNMKT